MEKARLKDGVLNLILEVVSGEAERLEGSCRSKCRERNHVSRERVTRGPKYCNGILETTLQSMTTNEATRNMNQLDSAALRVEPGDEHSLTSTVSGEWQRARDTSERTNQLRL